MLKPRTALLVLAGVFLFLVASLNRSQRAADCNAIADLLDEQLHLIDAELANYPVTDAKRNRQGLVEIAASLTRLQTAVDALSLSTNEMKKERGEISREIDKMQQAVNAMPIQGGETPLVVTARSLDASLLGANSDKILAEYDASRARLKELLSSAERTCVE